MNGFAACKPFDDNQQLLNNSFAVDVICKYFSDMKQPLCIYISVYG